MGSGPDRIGGSRSAADLFIYTPGSNAGLPVSILKSFAAPVRAIRDDSEALRDRINTAATSLLGLVGVSADPVQDREHILLSSLFKNALGSGQDLDLPTLIQQIMTPPFDKVGVVDLESFYPPKSGRDWPCSSTICSPLPPFRPGWRETPSTYPACSTPIEGWPRVSIFSIAHLSDSERMFFVSLLLNEVLGWVRTQSGLWQPAGHHLYGRDLRVLPAGG